MAKAVLSNRVFIETKGSLGNQIREKLTYKIATYGDGPPLVIRNFSNFRENVISVPGGRADLIPPGYEIVDKRTLNHVEFPEWLADPLRPSQQEICDDVDDNCLINAKPGWGKTYMALALAKKLGQKTLVIVHTLALMHQWKDEVKKVFGFVPGLIGDKHYNTDAPIVIGNVASLYKRMPELGKMFGLLIMDEVHHAPSPTFSKIVDKSYARYKIGLSGTLERKDGLHVLIPDYFGLKVYVPPVENTVAPTVHAYDTRIMFPFGGVWAHRVTELNQDSRYQNWSLQMIDKYTNLGHKVLFLADRVEFLKTIAEASSSALIIGGVTDREGELQKIVNGTTDCMCGTTSIWKEGISHNPLSCVILGSPINNLPMLEQIIGRVQRLCPEKLSPIVVDPILRGPTTEKQFVNRTGFYLKAGFTIEYL